MDQRIFLEFEYVFVICVVIVLFLVYLFYVRYPYDVELKVNDEGLEKESSTRKASMKGEK